MSPKHIWCNFVICCGMKLDPIIHPPKWQGLNKCVFKTFWDQIWFHLALSFDLVTNHPWIVSLEKCGSTIFPQIHITLSKEAFTIVWLKAFVLLLFSLDLHLMSLCSKVQGGDNQSDVQNKHGQNSLFPIGVNALCSCNQVKRRLIEQSGGSNAHWMKLELGAYLKSSYISFTFLRGGSVTVYVSYSFGIV